MTESTVAVGELIEINGLPGKWRKIEARYDYKSARTKCPNCGGLGIPWNGWFECDNAFWDGSCCGCVAVVETGEAFIYVGGDDGKGTDQGARKHG